MGWDEFSYFFKTSSLTQDVNHRLTSANRIEMLPSILNLSGGWLIAVRVFGILSAVLFILAFFAILSRMLGRIVCVPLPNKTKCQVHAFFSLVGGKYR